MKQIQTFIIGKVYIGNAEPFEFVRINAHTVRDALNIAANYLKPNHLQTLTVIGNQNEQTNARTI